MRRPGSAVLCLMLALAAAAGGDDGWRLPVRLADRRSWSGVRLTPIGRFGLQRKARPGIPAHRHTGDDFRRPSPDYENEPVYPAARGTVISVRDDGPYAQVIVEHRTAGGAAVWTAYEHLAGIITGLGDTVSPENPIGRFMSRRELDRYGWQFDHLHFEVLRERPLPARPTRLLPSRRFATFGLACDRQETLDRRYYEPEAFFEAHWR